jgi:hypothetical protein
MRYNFKVETNSQTFGLPYDIESIMQYENTAFSMNGQTAMIARNGKPLIAAYEKTDAQILTESDIKAIKTFYSCGVGPGITAKSITTTKKPMILAAPAIVTDPYFDFQLTNNKKLKFPIKLYLANDERSPLLWKTVQAGATFTEKVQHNSKWWLTSEDARYNKRFQLKYTVFFKNSK